MSKFCITVSLAAAAVLAAAPAVAKDGVFTGETQGVGKTPVQVAVTVKGGKLADIA